MPLDSLRISAWKIAATMGWMEKEMCETIKSSTQLKTVRFNIAYSP